MIKIQFKNQKEPLEVDADSYDFREIKTNILTLIKNDKVFFSCNMKYVI